MSKSNREKKKVKSNQIKPTFKCIHGRRDIDEKERMVCVCVFVWERETKIKRSIEWYSH